ncbi:hypothetical protein [Longispora albida]|uniref:hypothetical protein n=1 Tax=Longispora albida TaxID=203523 RepID=UPI00036AE6BB|nr:hypothetical protein [Longispora albida]
MSESKTDWRTAIFMWAGLPLIAGLALFFGSQDLIPSWKAHNGDGKAGIFSATYEECKKRRRGGTSCTLHGTWKADDGSATRAKVVLYDEPDTIPADGKVAALDTGAEDGVFAKDGGSKYLVHTGIVLVGLLAAAGWIFYIVRFFRKRAAKAKAFAPAG